MKNTALCQRQFRRRCAIESVFQRKAGTDITEEEKDPESMSFEELQRHIAKMMKQMNQAAAELNFEKAAKLRDRMIEYKSI